MGLQKQSARPAVSGAQPVGQWRVTLAIVVWAMTGAATPVIAGTPEEDFKAQASVVANAPQDILRGNQLRALCRKHQLLDECMEFFEGLAKKHPELRPVRYHAALALVDNLAGHAMLTQATYSTRAMDHASEVLEQAPKDWLALYIRGVNNLYWPSWYRRAYDAIDDLTICTQMSEALPKEQRREYMAQAHVALGDAYVKIEKIEQARAAWQRGMAAHPSAALKQRLAIEPAKLPAAIDEIRSREVPIDTNIDYYTAGFPGRS